MTTSADRQRGDGAEPPEARPSDGVLLVVTNLPDAASAQRVAQALVSERLAACVNVLAPCRSVYRWQGEIEAAQEVPLIIKTARDRFPALQRRLGQLHPYEVPEILAFEADDGLPAYLGWVVAQTRPAAEG